MSLKFKYLEAIYYGKHKIFEDLTSPIWSPTNIHQMLVTDVYIKDIFNVLISDYCNISYKGRFIEADHDIRKLFYMERYGKGHIINSWFRNFIILSQPTIHDNGDITLIKRYTKDSDYKPFVELVNDCRSIEVIDLNRPINPEFLYRSPTGRSAIDAEGSRVLERYQNLQKLNGGQE